MRKLEIIDENGYYIPREESCIRCLHLKETNGDIAICDKVDLAHGKRYASVCAFFDTKYPRELVLDDDGIPIRAISGVDYRTEGQWEHSRPVSGRELKPGAKGVPMHPKKGSKKIYTYYPYSETTTWDGVDAYPISTDLKRSYLCNQCIHCNIAHEEWHCHCLNKQKNVHILNARSCDDFRHRLGDHDNCIDNIPKSRFGNLPVRSLTGMDLRTESQWLQFGRKIKDGETGYEMYEFASKDVIKTYFLFNQTYLFDKKAEY